MDNQIRCPPFIQSQIKVFLTGNYKPKSCFESLIVYLDLLIVFFLWDLSIFTESDKSTIE